MTDEPETMIDPCAIPPVLWDQPVEHLIRNELEFHTIALARLEFMKSRLTIEIGSLAPEERKSPQAVALMYGYRTNALHNAVIEAVSRVNAHAKVLRAYGIGIPDVRVDDGKTAPPASPPEGGTGGA
jgi:hypothetical protein